MANIIFAVLLFIFGGVYYRASTQIPRNMLEDPVGASGFPRALAIIITVLALALLVQEVLAWRRRKAAVVAVAAVDDVPAAGLSKFRPTLYLLATLIAFLALFDALGYVLAVASMLLAVFFQSGMPLGWKPVVVAVAGAVAFRLVFGELLGVRLPPGLLAYLF